MWGFFFWKKKIKQKLKQKAFSWLKINIIIQRVLWNPFHNVWLLLTSFRILNVVKGKRKKKTRNKRRIQMAWEFSIRVKCWSWIKYVTLTVWMCVVGWRKCSRANSEQEQIRGWQKKVSGLHDASSLQRAWSMCRVLDDGSECNVMQVDFSEQMHYYIGRFIIQFALETRNK